MLLLDKANSTEPKAWLTYVNKEIGFSVKYPQSMEIRILDPKVFHIDNWVLGLEIIDKTNPVNAVIRMIVKERGDNRMVADENLAFLKAVCKTYKEFALDTRTAVNCTTCASASCDWSVRIPGDKQFTIFSMIGSELTKPGPEDAEYPILSIIRSIKFSN
jgi:hypothetical protein